VQVSLWNFVKYNVFSGGESALYGTEPWYYYLANSALNFNLTLPLALAFPLLATLRAFCALSVPVNWTLAVAVAPLLVWLPAVSALPHKEERFLYVTYPQACAIVSCTGLHMYMWSFGAQMSVLFRRRARHHGLVMILHHAWPACDIHFPKQCRVALVSEAASGRAQIVLAAACTLALLPRATSDIAARLIRLSERSRECLRRVGAAASAAALLATLLISCSRTAAVLWYYRAPLRAWRHVAGYAARLPERTDGGRWRVCVADEWHRFGSSFFLPQGTELAFVDSAFDGALHQCWSRLAAAGLLVCGTHRQGQRLANVCALQQHACACAPRHA
jgi:Alg9-like mannosyltransferase family